MMSAVDGSPGSPAGPAGVTAPAPSTAGGAGTVIRRIILFTILFALVTIAAIGVSGLIERVLGLGRVIIEDDAALARSLAYTLIGVPLAVVLWWWQRRRLVTDASERASLVWALYLTAMSLTALIAATTGLGRTATAAIEGEWQPEGLSTGMVWAAVWVWHRHMRRSARTGPTRLAQLPIELGALYGLIIGVSGAIAALAALISQALGVGPVLVQSQSGLLSVLQPLVWCLIGGLTWWWHWFRERADRAPGGFAGVLLVVVLGAAAAATLYALGTVLYVALRLLFDDAPLAEVLDPLDVASGTLLVGAIVWVYHARVLGTRSEQIRRAGRLVISAIALVGAASGIGVIDNAVLATLGPALVADDPRTLLLGGISALVVGGPAWWLAWRPDRGGMPVDAADPARRVYLVAVFGASAIVALVTILIIGFRLFEFALDAGGSGGLVERIRVPLGLLSATTIVFGYHFAIWRRDRASAPKASRRQIGRIILVASGDAGDHIGRIRSATGAPVTVWSAADADSRLDDADMAGLLESLRQLTAPRVLIVPVPGAGVRVIPMTE
jgi:hypothetical protein